MRVKSTLSVSKALSAAVAFVPQAWAGGWLVLILSALVGPVTHFAMAHLSLNPCLACVSGMAVRLVLMLLAWGALYRLALFGREARAEGLGLGGVQIGAPEVRLLLARIAIAAFVLVLIATIFIVFAVAFNTSGMAEGYDNTLAAVHAMLMRHNRVGDYVFIAYILASGLFLVFVGLKFSLMNASIVAERRLVTLNALGLTSGHVGELFSGMMAIFLPLGLVFGLGLHFLAPQIRFVHAWPHIEAHGPLAVWVQDAFNAGVIFVLWPLIIGFFASAYSQITEIRSK
jgi:hypothetical protein